jgi:multidrug efflux system outer membrane protein
VRRHGSAVALALLLLSASGCSLAPKHTVPPLPTPGEFPVYSAADSSVAVRATSVGWREFFVDERLKTIIDAALAHNRDLAIAVAQIEEARGLYRIQNADRLPTIGANAGATRSRIGAGTFGSGGVTAGPSGVTIDRYSVGVGVSAFELDFWGRVRNLSEAARSRFLATVQAQRSFRLSLIRDVASTYLFSLEAAERIRLAEATVASRQEGLRIAKVRFDAGITSALDYRQAESLLTQAEAELAGLRLAKAQSDNALAALVGAPVTGALPDALPLDRQVNPVPLVAGLPSELLVTRPDIIAAEEQLRAAEANVGAARAAYLPSISLTGSFGYASSELDNLVGKDGLTWSFGPAINLPIFDTGRRRANVRVMRARQTIAIASYERTIQTAFREVADALAARRYLAEQVAAQERGTVAQREIAALALTRYNEGVVGYIEVLDAERSRFAAEQALLQLRRAQVENLVSLYVALGGGAIEQR